MIINIPMNVEGSVDMFSMVQSSGFVVQAVLIMLIVLSVFSWAITVAKLLQYSKARQDSKEFAATFWESRNFTKVDETCKHLSASPLAQVFSSGYRELSNVIEEDKAAGEAAGQLNDEAKIEMIDTSMKRAQYQEGLRLERGLTFLASVASAAPFIGLFGTVWGIMNAFNGLSQAGSSTIQAVAPGISEALIATAIGLAAAIPAAVAYNYFAVAVKNFRENMDKFSGEFISIANRYFL